MTLNLPTLTVDLVAREASRNGGAVISVSNGGDGAEAAKRFGFGEGVFVWVQKGIDTDGADVSIELEKTPGEGAKAVMEHLISLGLISRIKS